MINTKMSYLFFTEILKKMVLILVSRFSTRDVYNKFVAMTKIDYKDSFKDWLL